MPQLDLNLLKVLDVMLEERSTTRAAQRLGITQSAVSHALNRLRYAVGDELFIRGRAGMQPTPRALEMGAQVHAALGQLQAALAPTDFSPATSERQFSLVAGSYTGAVLAPALVHRLTLEAPMTELSISSFTSDVLDRLDAHRLDFLVTSNQTPPPRIAHDVLLVEDLVWVVRSGHPLAEAKHVDLAALASVPQVMITVPFRPWPEEVLDRGGQAFPSAGPHNEAFEAALATHGLSRRVSVSVPDTYTALAVVARSDTTVLVPRRLAVDAALSAPFRLIEPPYESPRIELTLFYLRDRLAEPGLAWMRDLIRSTALAV
jgi:DNA-binding transcriptional LysR family regulator